MTAKPTGHADTGTVVTQQQVAKQPAKRGSLHGAEPRLFIHDSSGWRFATAEETLALNAQAAAAFQPILHANSLLRAGHFAEARAAVLPLLHDHGMDHFAASVFSEICINDGHYSEGLAALAPFLSDQSDQSDSLIAAVAGAMSGNVFPGQADFCRQVIARQLGSYQDLVFGAPAGDDLPSTKVCALLAFAASKTMENDERAAVDFYQRALTLAPHNPFASFELGDVAYRSGNWAQAESRYHVAAQYSSGSYRRIALQREAEAAYRRTHP